MKRERSKLFAQAKQRAVQSTVNSPLRVRIQQGSQYRKVSALIVAVSNASWRLKTVGAKQKLFGKRIVITSLVSKI